MERVTVIKRMQEDLDWLWQTARNEEEKESISLVELTLDKWFDSELSLQENNNG